MLLPSLDTVSGADVDLRGVGFSHGPHPVLADVTVTVGPQTRLAVVGPNGVGRPSRRTTSSAPACWTRQVREL